MMGLRPCTIGKEKRKALFHCWAHRAEVTPPSVLRGGHSGGQLSAVFGIVEFEDGGVSEVYPCEICFTDHAMYTELKIKGDISHEELEEMNEDVERLKKELKLGPGSRSPVEELNIAYFYLSVLGVDIAAMEEEDAEHLKDEYPWFRAALQRAKSKKKESDQEAAP